MISEGIKQGDTVRVVIAEHGVNADYRVEAAPERDDDGAVTFSLRPVTDDRLERYSSALLGVAESVDAMDDRREALARAAMAVADDEIRRAKAEALREAADAIERAEKTCAVQRTCHSADAITLRTRADQIESADDE